MNSNILLPYVPEYITVHLDAPGAYGENVTISFQDYIKNVASSEIYPTWPESAIRANILAQVSFALNRIYTEYYRSRGYDFDITNSTTVDQSFVNGRDIFDNISQIVDEIFNNYIVRQGSVEPLFAAYCDGERVQCNGLSQWGSVALAVRGYTPYRILTEYYGDDIGIVTDAPIEGYRESYPGIPLRLGSSGNDVSLIQTRLNRIARNFPSIPQISPVDGFFTPNTENTVKAFQKTVSLIPDGVVGRATWYQIARVYNAVKRISDINSEGIQPEDVTGLFDEVLNTGSEGSSVRELQYLLDFVSIFNNYIPPTTIDGIFGSSTEDAVKAFQTYYGLNPDGIVGNSTWRELYSVYSGYVKALPEGFLPTEIVLYPGYPVGEGSSGYEIRALQEYLNLISDTYTRIPKLTVDGAFGPSTRAAVEAYQQQFGIPTTGIVTSFTWNSIVDSYLALR